MEGIKKSVPRPLRYFHFVASVTTSTVLARTVNSNTILRWARNIQSVTVTDASKKIPAAIRRELTMEKRNDTTTHDGNKALRLTIDLTKISMSTAPSETAEDDSTHHSVIDLTNSATDDPPADDDLKCRKRAPNHQRKRRRGNDTTNHYHEEAVDFQQVAKKNYCYYAAAAGRKRKVFDCSICLERGLERFQGYALTHCGHWFCRQCLHGYIQSKLCSEKTTGGTTCCPNPECRKFLLPSDVRACTLEVGDSTLWRSYQEISTETYLDSAVAAASSNDDPSSATMRRCPSDRCNFTFSFEPAAAANNNDHPQGQLFICPECDQAYCLNCPVVQGNVGPAHDDTCASVLEELRKSKERQVKLEQWKVENSRADVRFQELLRREGGTGRTKRCPKCRTVITKNGGCDHMHCSRCGINFNWSQVPGP